MNPIQLNKHQIEALNNGATMLWMVLDERTNEHIEDFKLYKDDTKLIECHSSLQIGQEYYVQEKFYLSNYATSTHQGIYYSEYRNIVNGCTKLDASQMQEYQSRIKFKVTDIQVRRIQDAYEPMAFEYVERGQSDYIESEFSSWYNEQYPDQPYEDNPHGFLVQIERID